MTPLALPAAIAALTLTLGTLPAAPAGADTPDDARDARASHSPTLLLTSRTTPAPLPARRGSATQAYPVPTSDAHVGRIVTAPDGDLWFTERDQGSIARVTPSGTFTTYQLTDPDDGWVRDLDVAPDGTVWVLFGQGEYLVGLSIADDGTASVSGGPYDVGSFGDTVRVDPTGVPWVTVNYDDSYVVRVVGGAVVSSANSPECDGVLGLGADHHLWCSKDEHLVRLDATASGGAGYTLPSDATYAAGLAAGPAGSIWFTRNDRGSTFTSPGEGSVGYVDAATGAVRVFDTGTFTAPEDLVAGPDRTMWFTVAGSAFGIGHVSTSGRGGVTRLGSYHPSSLTFAHDGSLWFTDSTDNLVVRTTTDQLRRTNVRLGADSVLVPQQAGRLRVAGHPVTLRPAGVPVTLTCPGSAPAGCRGTLRMLEPGGRHRLLGGGSYDLDTERVERDGVPLTPAGRRALGHRARVTVLITLTAEGARHPGFRARLQVRGRR